ncbi:MAG: PEP-utilizing enzyme [Anaerolineae bacterium]|jgi:pyruvate,water dikinase|nr:PEP-utilizing enzyme [Anaerolineae bacterium]MDH7474960.1 PEP/pyruvate-binding domain-containing protein [Anaerolineae bacterium]
MTDQEAGVLWLEAIRPEHSQAVGAKAANLAALRRAGLPVAPGFCIPANVYRDFVRANELEHDIVALLDAAQSANDQKLESAADHLRRRFVSGTMDKSLARLIVEAYEQLVTQSPVGIEVAVRSSATLEDLPTASFAGQGDTYLNVAGADEVLDCVRRCWASLWTARAVRYRQTQKLESIPPAMAILVQAMIPTEVGGVAFSVHPITGADEIVIEAAPGLAEAVVQGTAEVTRYVIPKGKAEPSVLPKAGPELLTTAQLRQLVEAVLRLENLFGGPQDVEWGFWQGQLYIFQARPITTADPARAAARAFFTREIPDDDYLWTGGYLNERFPRPVSPLGWSVVGGLTEELALRDPLRYLGYHHANSLPLTKLHRGHPYANALAFQMFYKVFPDALMPEDAYRYFLNGNISLRKQAPYPCCLLDPRFIASMLWHFIHEPGNWSPLHNYRYWQRFVSHHQVAMEEVAQRLMEKGNSRELGELWGIVGELQGWHRKLLGIHRWSLTAADLTLAALKWLVGDGDTISRLLTGLPNKSVEMDLALYNLRQSADGDNWQSPAWQDFLARYGHRSFSLDIYYPTFADDPTQAQRLLQSLLPTPPDLAARAAERQATEERVRATLRRRPFGRLRSRLFDWVLALAREYVILREEQRFHWQRALALQRRAFLLIGEKLAAEGLLTQADDVFFLTITEIENIIHEKHIAGRDFGVSAQSNAAIPSYKIAAARRREFEQLQREWELAPHLAYPAFLQGNQPLAEAVANETRWRGRAVSPGVARGPARVVLSPQQFDKIRPGDVLVTRSTDPGWTPLFGRLAGLIMERGGQLSHGAVVAREYGLPAVAGIPGITALLRDGDLVEVDGLTGVVTLSEHKT